MNSNVWLFKVVSPFFLNHLIQGVAVKRCLGFCVVMFLLLLQGGCVTPYHDVVNLADDAGFIRTVELGTDFHHLVYRNHPRRPTKTLHVYIEGDGRPWETRTHIANDPASYSIVLPLMAMDKQTSLYIGRPCYFTLKVDARCHNNHWWTGARYSQDVVMSMVAVLEKFLQNNAVDQVVLIGHSGGGALAVLMAPYIPQTVGVVTLGGNLAVNDWAHYHQYTPLYASIDPLYEPPLKASIFQLHFWGRGDQTITYNQVRAYVAQQNGAHLIALDNVTHSRYWDAQWSQILHQIDRYTLSGEVVAQHLP